MESEDEFEDTKGVIRILKSTKHRQHNDQKEEDTRTTNMEHLSSPLVLSVVRGSQSLVLYVYFVDHWLSFCPFPFAIVLSVHLRYKDSHYPFGIFKIFFLQKNTHNYWPAFKNKTKEWYNDWLTCNIDYCLTSCEEYFSYFKDD